MARRLLLALAVVFVCAVCASNAVSHDYGIMVDAGSSGTRVFLYRWESRVVESKHPTPPTSFPDTQQPNWGRKTNMRLADKGLTTEGTQELCSWLITEARELAALVGQSDRLASIPFFLGATAGLRLLPYASRELIMSNTRGWLVTVANNPFLFSPLYAKILSGEEEAVFGWIAVNYLSNRFNGQSVGALDLGGASTQLTVDPRASIMESYFDYAGPYNRRYGLYAKSYLEYGNDNMLHSIMLAIANDATTDFQSLPHPCFNAGYSTSIINDNNINATLTGSSNHTACVDIVRSFMQPKPCWADKCAFAGAYQPPLPNDVPFYAFAGYPRILRTAGMTVNASLPIRPQAIIDHTENTVCAKTWDELQALYPESDPRYLSQSCASLSYASNLITTGYGLSPTADNIYFADFIDGVEVSWALGRILYEANQLAWDPKIPCDKGPSIIPAIIVAGLSALAAIILGALLYRSRASLAEREALLTADHSHAVQMDSDVGQRITF